MTKKDYTLIAQALHEVRPEKHAENNILYDAKIETWTACIGNLIKHLHKNNPRFDSERFLIACERGQIKSA